MTLFADRTAAGRELTRLLGAWRGTDAVVFGIPRGGIVVAAEVAHGLDLPLEAVVVRKLGVPSQEEFAVGAIAADVRIVDSDAVRRGLVSRDELDQVERAERVELDRRTELFRTAHHADPPPTAIVVDDGIATGSTAVAACRALRARGAGRIVLAVPVAPSDWAPDRSDVDDYVCVHRPRDFRAVGRFYDDFTQTADAEVLRLLSASTGEARRD